MWEPSKEYVGAIRLPRDGESVVQHYTRAGVNDKKLKSTIAESKRTKTVIYDAKKNTVMKNLRDSNAIAERVFKQNLVAKYVTINCLGPELDPYHYTYEYGTRGPNGDILDLKLYDFGKGYAKY